MSYREEDGQGIRELAEKVMAARSAWLESYGVPISWEFARFAEAIGNLTDHILKPSPVPSCTPSVLPRSKKEQKGSL